jgi:hypothetical protein
MQLILFPLPLVSYISASVIKSASTFHFILKPLSTVFPALLVVKGTKSMPHPILLVSLVFPSIVLFSNEIFSIKPIINLCMLVLALLRKT